MVGSQKENCMFTYLTSFFKKNVIYTTSKFPIMHLICPEKKLRNRYFSFLLDMTAVPREIENSAYAKFWGRK